MTKNPYFTANRAQVSRVAAVSLLLVTGGVPGTTEEFDR